MKSQNQIKLKSAKENLEKSQGDTYSEKKHNIIQWAENANSRHLKNVTNPPIREMDKKELFETMAITLDILAEFMNTDYSEGVLNGLMYVLISKYGSFNQYEIVKAILDGADLPHCRGRLNLSAIGESIRVYSQEFRSEH